MNILCEEKIINFDRRPSVEEIIIQINNLMDNTSNYLSHIIVNGIEIYSEVENFLEDQLDNISQLEIITKSSRELIFDIITSTKEYIIRALPEIKILSNDFYQNPNKDTWSNFVKLLEGLQWIIEMIRLIEQINKKPENWIEIQAVSEKMITEIENIQIAVENKDYIFVADIIQYEIIPIFNEIHSFFNSIIKKGEYINDIN